MTLSAGAVTLNGFAAAMRAPVRLNFPGDLNARLEGDRRAVEQATTGEAPVYGLNTGLGANLGHRLAPRDIAAFQVQLIEGRAVAVGPHLPAEIGRGLILSRILSAGQGGSGISPSLFEYLLAFYQGGLAPGVPEFGSIGASDLTQNAVATLALLGRGGKVWRRGEWLEAADALSREGLTPPELQPKDAMVLINHSGLSVALSASALTTCARALALMRAAALLSYAGYDANRAILSETANALRPSPGQAEVAAWFRDRLSGGAHAPRRVQEALSFRTLAPVLGAVIAALNGATAIWQDEANGLPDSPAVMADGTLRSTANFHAPALALALENLSLANAMAAMGGVQRSQRMMSPDLSGLPRYLSPPGGASAGMVPLQKTLAALLAEVRRHAFPATLDPAPVSEAVEDMAPLTALAARKLNDQCRALTLIGGAEALVACQAIDLREAAPLSAEVARLHRAVRARVPALREDRALGRDVETTADILRAEAEPL